MSVAEMRAELKLLREEHPDYRPVSKMKKADISSLLEKMKQHTEITPAIAFTKKDPVKPAPGEVKEVKAVSESLVEKMPKGKVKAKVEPEHKAEHKPEKVKETLKDRMARLRAMRKRNA